MIFLGIAIPIGILLGLLLFFSGLYNRNRLAAAASGGLDMFTTNFENQLDSVENYLLNLSLNDATFRSLSEQTDRTRAYLDAYEIAQGFPAVLAANDALMGVVLRSGSGNLYVGRYGETAQQLKQKLNLEAYLGQPGQTNKMMTRGWYLRTIGQRLYLLRSVFYQKASLTAAVDLRLVFEELVKDYGLDGRVIVMNDSGNVLVGDANLLPTKMEWNSAGYCMTKMGRDSRLVVRKQVKALTVLYLVPYQHFGVDFAPYQILLVMGAVFVLLAIPFILFYMKQEIFAPMTALVSTMDRIGRGELSVRSSVDYRNAEFTQVNETFNRMIDQITQLKIDGYEKELEARRNEMTALKLQIRPHFVLNCLKSVYAMVQTGSREDAQQLILLLSRYLRYILSFTATTTPLHTEIEQCCNYAELSSVGQNDPVEVVCEIDPELSELPLPPVSLLTLVENSVKHGKMIGKTLKITITAKLLETEEGCMADLSVADNGTGFTAGDLKQLNSAAPNVKEEWAALELQSRGAVFDDQKKEIVETMLRGFLLGNAPGSSLTAFEELSLVPRRERECWVALMQPLRWKQGEEPWELSLLSTAVGNMSSEVFTPLQVLSATVAIPAEQCLVLVLQSRVGEPLEADYITRQLNYLQSACAQYINCEASFYPEGPQPFEQVPEIYQKLLQQRSENVALKSGVLLGRPAEKAPEVFRIPQIGAWQKLLQAGCAQAMEQEACQLLDKLTANNQLNSQTLRYFYQDFMQMLFSLPEKKRQDDMFREPEALELYRNGMKTVPDMKALVHYVASVWDSETEESSQSTVEIIMAYIAEHLENELRREELAEAVHLNPDYMARLFKKETGMNLKDYIIQQKMQEAQSLLCTTNLPISLIAAKVGYTNFGHFSTSYKKFYHKTPQEERSAAL